MAKRNERGPKSAVTKANRRIKARIRAHEVFADFKYRLVFEGALVGFLTGTIVSMFRLVLSYSDEIRTAVIDLAKERTLYLVIAIAILAVLAVITAVLVKKESMISGSGIPQVKGEIEGYFDQNWIRVLACKFVGGFCAITAGLSLGREGPSIQLGAMIGKGVSTMSPRLENDKRTLMICGAGAGLACAFSAPLAGIIFTMEELQKKYTTEAMIATMASSIIADFVASYIFGLRPIFTLNPTNGLPLIKYWEIFVLGIVLGILGAVYNRGIALSQDLFDKLGGKGKILLPFALIIVLAIFYPQVLGSGHELVGYAGVAGHGLKVMLVLLLIKFVFSVLSFGTGAPGGIFLPLLVMGAVSGGTFGEILNGIFGMGSDYTSLFVVLGMAGLFSAIVRAPLTGIVLITEMTGVFSNLLPISIVAFVSYIVAEFNYAQPIYDQLLARLLRKNGIEPGMSRHTRLR